MNVKDIRGFRTYLLAGELSSAHDENFVGHSHEKTDKWGLFKVYHGKKANVGGFLHKEVEMAEDGQSIYEFIQNAADCDATHFWMYFDEEQFLVINNGAPFTASGIESILNVGQSDGKDKPGKIGRFGIGFKLVHRLVGEASGLPEMMNDYAGPILFSWSQPEQFKQFREADEEIGFTAYDHHAAAAGAGDPWLLKILLTCFPALPGEEVRDLDYEPREVFTSKEVTDCRSFLAEHTASLGPDLFSQGSMFYLRLGKGKAEKLRSEEELLRNGVASSMHFLGHLQHIQVQQSPVNRLQALHIEPFKTPIGSPERAHIRLTDKRDLDSSIQLFFGFPPVEQATELLRTEPVFYKYFPAGDETAPYTFILHSNVISVESNRRKLHDGPVNKDLLRLAADQLKQRFQDLVDEAATQEASAETARRIWGNLVLSDSPTGNHEWQKNCFYNPLLAIAGTLVPTTEGFQPAEKVRIKRTGLPVTPADFGLGDEWLYWPYGTEVATHAAAKEKLGLQVWEIEDLLARPAYDTAIAAWLRELPVEMYPLLRKELNAVPATSWTKQWMRSDKTTFTLYQRFADLELFSLTESEFTSLNSLRNDPNLLLLENIRPEDRAVLEQLGFKIVLLNDQWSGAIYHHIRSQIIWLDPARETSGNQELFKRVSERTAGAALNVAAKLRLMMWLDALKGVGEATIRKIVLFENALGEKKPLDELMASSVNVPEWLHWAQINQREYTPSLDKFLLKPAEYYIRLIQMRWASWKKHLTQDIKVARNIDEFCRLVCEWYGASVEKTPLPDGKGALTETSGYLAEKQIFYSPHLKNVSLYESLGAAIQELYKLYCPAPAMLPWLDKAPFVLTATRLGAVQIGQSVALPASQFEALVQLALAEGTSLTSQLTIQVGRGEEDGYYVLTPRRNGWPKGYHATDNRIQQYLVTHHAQEFHAVPKEFSDSLGREAEVLRNEDLRLALVQVTAAGNLLQEDLLQLLRAENLQGVTRNWLKRLGELQLDLQEEYSIDHPDRILLELAAHHLPAAEMPAFRQRLWLRAPWLPASFTLDQIAQADEVKLIAAEDKLTVLSRAALLPGADKRGEAVNLLARRMGSTEEINNLLGLNSDHNLAQLQRDLLAELAVHNNTIQNATQLVFVLLTAKYASLWGTQNLVSRLNAFSCAPEPRSLTGPWLLAPQVFILPQFVLADRYNDLSELMSEKLPWEIPGSFSLLGRPRLTSAGFRAPGLRSDLAPGEQELLLDYLFRQWSDRISRSGAPDLPTDWSRLTPEYLFAQVLGFTPEAVIAVPSLALAEELPPAWLSAWEGTNSPEQKAEFLLALGVSTESSPLAKLRRAFLAESSDSVLSLLAPYSNVTVAKRQQLTNTIQWLHQHQIALVSSAHQELFQGILRLLPVKQYKLNLFVYLSAIDETGNHTYRLSPVSTQAYLLDAATRQHLQDQGITLSFLMPLVAKAGYQLLDLGLYPADGSNNWRNELTAKELRVSTEFDRTTLQQEANPVDLPEWLTTTQTRVKVYAKLLPQLRDLLTHSLPALEQEPLWFDAAERTIYVTESRLADLPDLLAARYASAFSAVLLAQLRKELLSQRDNALREAQDRITRLEALLAARDAAHDFASQLPSEPTARKALPTSSLSAEEKALVSAEAKTAVREALAKISGYDCTNWNEEFTSIHGVTLHGEAVPIVVKGVGAGHLYITPNEWNYLASSPKAQLFVFDSRSGVRNVRLQDVEARNQQFFMQFDVERHIISGVKAFAEFFRYLPYKANFVFSVPGHSNTDDFYQSFGLYERHQPVEGEVTAQPLSAID